jgi:ABC-type multidrug transport system ATPase subunit
MELSDGGIGLSGGQRQRVGIARALLTDAPIVLLDEPTTGLDAESSRRVLAPLRRLMAGRTTIIISHDLLTVADADRILFLEQGRIAAVGTHSQLLRSSPRYAQLYRLHQRQLPERSVLPLVAPRTSDEPAFLDTPAEQAAGPPPEAARYARPARAACRPVTGRTGPPPRNRQPQRSHEEQNDREQALGGRAGLRDGGEGMQEAVGGG